MVQKLKCKDRGKRAVRIGMMELPRVDDTGGNTTAIFKDLGFVVETLSRQDIERDRFGEFDLLHCPGGHSVKLSDRGVGNIQRYLRGGKGLLGICAGCHFIAHAKLLDIDLLIVRAVGLYNVRLVKRHALTRGFKLVPRTPEKKGYNPVPHSDVGRMRMHRGNGGFIVARNGVDLVATYDNDDRFGAIAAGPYGRGRVVAISCHPQIEVDWRRVRGLHQRTDPRVARLLENAVRFCAG
ncbi:MAG: hypothetical protein JXR37_07430 [Kiritimatiellae bacterium]|nr:hypothetical protein [Kiritimatiellia bacterium]